MRHLGLFLIVQGCFVLTGLQLVLPRAATAQFRPSPCISSFDPESMVNDRPTSVAVEGSGFDETTRFFLNDFPAGGAELELESDNLALRDLEPDRATLHFPAGLPARVFWVGAQNSDAGGCAVGFEVFDSGVAPSLDGVDPSSGPSGTPVEIIGARFVHGATVSLGGRRAGVIQIGVPAGLVVPLDMEPGRYDVVLDNPNGLRATLAEAFTVTGEAVDAAMPADDGGTAPRTAPPMDSGGCSCSAWRGHRPGTRFWGPLLFGFALWYQHRRARTSRQRAYTSPS